jgi:hypothetical protein
VKARPLGRAAPRSFEAVARQLGEHHLEVGNHAQALAARAAVLDPQQPQLGGGVGDHADLELEREIAMLLAEARVAAPEAHLVTAAGLRQDDRLPRGPVSQRQDVDRLTRRRRGNRVSVKGVSPFFTACPRAEDRAVVVHERAMTERIREQVRQGRGVSAWIRSSVVGGELVRGAAVDCRRESSSVRVWENARASESAGGTESRCRAISAAAPPPPPTVTI